MSVCPPVFDAVVAKSRSWFEPACGVTSIDVPSRMSSLLRMPTSPPVAGIANGFIGGQAIEPCY